VVRRSARKATAEAVLCSAVLAGSAVRAREGAGEGESWRERVEMERAHTGELKPRSSTSWTVWSGQRRRATIAMDMRHTGSAGGRPLNGFVQFVQSRNAEPDDEFCNRVN